MVDDDEVKGFRVRRPEKSSLSTYVADQYRLADFSICPIKRTAQTFVARIVDVTHGPKVTYCLKSHLPHKTWQRVETQHAAVAKLRSVGFHLLPAADRTKSGATVFNADGKLWSMYDFVESGPPFDWTFCTWGTADAAAAGEALAQMHKASLKLSTSAADVGQVDVLNNVESWLTAAMERLADSASNSFSLREPLKNSLLEILHDLVETLKASSAQGHLLIHGDFHPGNVLIANKRVVGIVDYDDFQMGQRVQDVAYGALTFALATDKEKAASTEDSAVNEERLSAFLAGYEHEWRRHQNLDAWAPESLNAWIKLSAFLIIYWCLDRMADSRDNVAILRGALELAVRVATGTCAVTGQLHVSTRS